MKLPRRDLDEVAASLAGEWERIRGARVLITGATGFVGRWLIETFSHANSSRGLHSRMFALIRDPASFSAVAPHIAADATITMIKGDLRSPDLKYAELADGCDFVIHAATASSHELSRGDPRNFVDTIEATRRLLDVAVSRSAQRFLYLSSGAVYGRQPVSVSRLSEDFEGGPNPLDPASPYAEAKRAGEVLCAAYATRQELGTVIARGFAFIGPHLPLGGKFAAGSFLSDVLERRPVRVNGDGTAIRSYLYAADLAVWLWTLLLRGTPGRAYNVGGETAVSIGELAAEAASLAEPAVPVQIAKSPDPTSAPDRYVPSTERARTELGLKETVDWRESLRRTYEWHRKQPIPETMTRTSR